MVNNKIIVKKQTNYGKWYNIYYKPMESLQNKSKDIMIHESKNGHVSLHWLDIIL